MRRAAVLTASLTLVLLELAPMRAGAVSAAGPNCAGWVGNPTSGSAAWRKADALARECALQGTLDSVSDIPAAIDGVFADPGYIGDPLRDPSRGWAGTRGTYLQTSFVDRYGSKRGALLFGPKGGGQHPGIVIPCYTALPSVRACSWYWTAELLAESGYVVVLADTAIHSPAELVEGPVDAVMGLDSTQDALNWFLSRTDPWAVRIDQSLVGCVGHSGNGSACLRLATRDRRVKAVVALDPAGGDGGNDLTSLRTNALAAPVVLDFPSVPTMIQRGDYWLADPLTPKLTKPAPYYQESDFAKIRANGADEMHIVIRGATHFDFSRTFGDSILPYTRYGEQVASYYTLAWFDRYLRGAKAPGVAADALRRLTISAAQPFDRSSDVHSIGTGTYNARTGKNMPDTIGGIPVRNLLSYQFHSAYSLDHGSVACNDIRSGCSSVPQFGVATKSATEPTATESTEQRSDPAVTQRTTPATRQMPTTTAPRHEVNSVPSLIAGKADERSLAANATDEREAAFGLLALAAMAAVLPTRRRIKARLFRGPTRYRRFGR